MGDPTNLERGLAPVQLDDPAFLAWARQHGNPINRGTPAAELGELLAQYEYELREQKRIAAEKSARLIREIHEREPKPFYPQQQAQEEDKQLREMIRAGWRTGDPSLKAIAEADVSKARPLAHWLHESHGAERDKDRWTYMRHYLYAYHSGLGEGTPSEDALLEAVLQQEKIYLAERKRSAETFARAQRPALQREALRAWARKQALNPADDFAPGIAYYDMNNAMSKPDWVDRDIANISQAEYITTITYTRRGSLSFPTNSLDFKAKYQHAITDVFTRRHKATGRLIPFVLYLPSVDLYADLPQIDALSATDRVLMALPYMLTGAVAGWYAQDPLYQVAGGLIGVLKLLALQKSLMMATAPLAGVLTTGTRTAYQLGTGGLALGSRVAGEVTFAVTEWGYNAQAAVYLGRAAYTYYLTNAVAINFAVTIGTPIALELAGQDPGPINPGDELTMALQVEQKAVKAAVQEWKAIRGEVEVLKKEAGAAKAVLRVTSAETITEEVAKAEYDLGKKVGGQAKEASRKARAVDDAATDARATKASGLDVTKPAPPVVPPGAVPLGKGGKLPPDPRKIVPTGEIEAAMTNVAKGLERLGANYDPKALEKIKNLSADAIRESGINPTDLANLANSLSRAGPTTRKFVNDFHDVPGFERVLLGWAKRSYWNSKLKTPAWTTTKAFYTGSSYVMKYATKRLDPRYVRFEWPVSINDTKWGEEVFARYVDIVVEGGSAVRPGERIQLELKSWTEFVLRKKTRFPPGRATTYPGTVGYQLLRDTALFQPDNIRWVFDGNKVTKDKVLGAFMEIIADDAYLRAQWGGADANPVTIRQLLDKVIEVF